MHTPKPPITTAKAKWKLHSIAQYPDATKSMKPDTSLFLFHRYPLDWPICGLLYMIHLKVGGGIGKKPSTQIKVDAHLLALKGQRHPQEADIETTISK